MKKQIFFWSLVSALAGFLFGFDTVVISGAEQHIQTLWGLSDGMQGFAIGSAFTTQNACGFIAHLSYGQMVMQSDSRTLNVFQDF